MKTEIFWNMILRGFIIMHRRVVQVYFADWIIGALIFCTTCCGVMDGTMVGYFQGGCCLVLEEELALAQPPLFAPVGVELLFHLPDAQCTQHTGCVTQNIYTICRDNLSIYRTQYAICIVCSHTIQIPYKYIPCVQCTVPSPVWYTMYTICILYNTHIVYHTTKQVVIDRCVRW